MKCLRSGFSSAQKLTQYSSIPQSLRWTDSAGFGRATVLRPAHLFARFLQHTNYSPTDDGKTTRLFTPGDTRTTRSNLEDVDATGLHSIGSQASSHGGLKLKRTIVGQVDSKEFPLVCPGCGAYSQVTAENEPGYYTTQRNDVKLWLAKRRQVKTEEDEETELVNRSLANLDSALLESLEISVPDPTPKQKVADTVPFCGRCHALLHHNDLKQQSIVHPSINTVRDMLDESPHRRNHVYHVIDAADFPMSLIPNIASFFDIAVRSKNRRAKSHRWAGGQDNRLSFIITRADLISYSKQSLDKMMPYLQDVLRDALGKLGANIRLGNVWCVSARQGWWTKSLKHQIYQNGGGGWLVGKVNVGKSQLYEAVFPKGYKEDTKKTEETGGKVDLEDSLSLLPPLPAEEKYPLMPTVSQLPGTTALPIRNLYGNGRGELIDLPGLPRNELYEVIKQEAVPNLYHSQRIAAEQITILSGNSLLISNLIQIKPVGSTPTMLAAPFVPLACSARSDSFAVSVLDQTCEATTAQNKERSIARPEVASIISSAGTFKLAYNVTRQRTGPLTRRDAVALPESALSFVVFGLDILIEGVGWVELSCQVRKRFLEELGDPDWRPEVEVFSPNGKYIGARRPMNAYMSIGLRRKPKSQRTKRPRLSMKGHKKAAKKQTREQTKQVHMKEHASKLQEEK